ncbi:hypothetical protein UT300012_23760 [Paraclostridium bifermentans]
MHKRLQAYIVVSDLHSSYKNKDNRHDYLGEIEFVIDKIFETCKKYIELGYEVCLIFLGDITDNSFKDQSKAIYFNNLFVLLQRLVSKIYCVIGNHEMSYYKDNPFWSLMTSINSERIKKVITRSWQPTGAIQLVEVLDTLDLGNTVLHFNHHATDVSRPIDGKTNIGLFHKDIISSAIIEDLRLNEGVDIFEAKPTYIEKNPEVLRGYKACLFGHMHKIYGKWIFTDDLTSDEIELIYLASLGRPNQTEVMDNLLVRNLPAIIIDTEGNLVNIEDNLITLPSRSEAIKEDIVEKQQEAYKKRKERKYFLDYVSYNDDPIENIKSALSQYGSALSFFEGYLEENTPDFERQMIKDIERVRYK